ncbi:hypothetical protein C2E23DRAFT_244078 [Lenzites betulinus]|nr:hypothetical protein C2E23DRAFT_244078 [Lenzites betulinus]
MFAVCSPGLSSTTLYTPHSRLLPTVYWCSPLAAASLHLHSFLHPANRVARTSHSAAPIHARRYTMALAARQSLGRRPHAAALPKEDLRPPHPPPETRATVLPPPRDLIVYDIEDRAAPVRHRVGTRSRRGAPVVGDFDGGNTSERHVLGMGGIEFWEHERTSPQRARPCASYDRRRWKDMKFERPTSMQSLPVLLLRLWDGIAGSRANDREQS